MVLAGMKFRSGCCQLKCLVYISHEVGCLQPRTFGFGQSCERLEVKLQAQKILPVLSPGVPLKTTPYYRAATE